MQRISSLCETLHTVYYMFTVLERQIILHYSTLKFAMWNVNQDRKPMA